MKLTAQLTHFDAQIAVCLATIEHADKQVSVYASAAVHEAGNFADLAQKRALQLARRLLNDEFDALNEIIVKSPEFLSNDSEFVEPKATLPVSYPQFDDQQDFSMDTPTSDTDVPPPVPSSSPW